MYSSIDVAKELARDMVGCNRVAVRFALTEDSVLRDTRYFVDFASAKDWINRLLEESAEPGSPMKELWIGCRISGTWHIAELLAAWEPKRKFGQLILTKHLAQIFTITFE
jgi:hypothetical protein